MGLTLKEHVKGGVLTISLCDTNLIGKTFEEGMKYLDLTTSFYSGEEVSEEVAKDMLNRARSATVTGEEAVKIGKEMFPDSLVIEIKKIPFMNIMKF